MTADSSEMRSRAGIAKDVEALAAAMHSHARCVAVQVNTCGALSSITAGDVMNNNFSFFEVPYM